MCDTRILVLLAFAAACHSSGTDGKETGEVPETGETGETAETGDTQETGETATAYVPHDGRLAVCVTTDRPDVHRATGEVVGTAGAEGEGYERLGGGKCWSAPARHLDVIDGDGYTWRLGWALYDDGGADVTPSLSVPKGSEVEVRARDACGEGCSTAFSLLLDGALHAAVQEGYWGRALDAADLPGLSVAEGAELGEVDTGCGIEMFTTLLFQGDDALELEPFASGLVTVGGAARTAWAVGAHRYTKAECTDTSDTFAWLLAP